MRRLLPIVFLPLLGGCFSYSVPVHRYPYVTTAPSTVVLPPSTVPQVVVQPYYGAGTLEDPTAVVVWNTSFRVTYRVRIDDGDPIVLLPGQPSGNIHLPVGPHRVLVEGEIPSALGPLPIRPWEFSIMIEARGRGHPIWLPEP